MSAEMGHLAGEPGRALVERAFRDHPAEPVDEGASETITLPLAEADSPATSVVFRRYFQTMDNVHAVEVEQARYYFGGRHFIEVHAEGGGMISTQHGERKPVNAMTTQRAEVELFPDLSADEHFYVVNELAESALGRSLSSQS